MIIRLQDQLVQVGEAISEFCEDRTLLLLCAFSSVYFLTTCALATQKPMWNDELFTFYISRLPSTSDIWSAVLTGGEQIPPVFHIITRISMFLFGVNELATRIPEVVGFWVMSLCLFWFVSKRTSSLYGLAAMLFPLMTEAYYYAYEARPYGIVLGFAGLSLVCWQSAAAGRHRKLSLIGLALSLGAAVLNHYYAVLLFVPLAIGETARSIPLRRLDLSIWTALGSGMPPLLLFLPLIQRATIHSSTFWSQPQWNRFFEFYYFLLAPTLFTLLALLALSAVCSVVRPTLYKNYGYNSRFAPPFYEIVAALGFLSLPVIGFVLAKLFTGALTHRYVLPSIIGFSILFAFAAYSLLNGRAIMGSMLVVSLCCGFVLLERRTFLSLADEHLRQSRTYEFLRSDSENKLPIVASDLGTFMQLSHYGPRDIASRLVYLADPEASLRHLGHNSVDRGILDLKPWFPLKIESYRPYIDSQRRLLVYVRGYMNNQRLDFKWLLSELGTIHWQIELRNRNQDGILFLVTRR